MTTYYNFTEISFKDDASNEVQLKLTRQEEKSSKKKSLIQEIKPTSLSSNVKKSVDKDDSFKRNLQKAFQTENKSKGDWNSYHF